MMQGINIFALLLLQFLEPCCKILVTATSNAGIYPAMNFVEWAINDPYESVEPSETMDVPLRYEILPTPVAFDMPNTDYYYPRQRSPDAEQYEIIPSAAMPLMPVSSFRHIIHKRQAADENTEGCGDGEEACAEFTTFANGERTDDPSCQTYNSAGCTSTFQCNANYILNGASQLTCSGTPGQTQWNAEQPTCVLNVCPELTNPQNGNRDDGSGNCPTYNTVGCTVTFTCINGYSINGQSQLTCLASGQWSAQTPTCQINVCTPLTSANAPPNGIVTSICAFAGCVGTYGCNEGHALVGDTTTVCQADGTWNGTTPTCNIRDCGNAVVEDGTVSGATTTYGSTISITCNANYTLVGNAQSTCQADGTWSQLPTCEYHCGTPPNTPNATLVFTCDTPSCTANITCSNGFVLEGSSLTCVKDFGWSYQPYCRDNTTNPTGEVISITIPAPGPNFLANFEANILQALQDYYGDTMGSNYGSFIQIIILNIVQFFFTNNNSGTGRRKRELEEGKSYLQVNYTILAEGIDYGELSKAQADTVALDKPLTLFGEPVYVQRTSIYGLTYLREGGTDFETLKNISCQIFEVTTTCPADSECQVDVARDITYCQEPISTEDNFPLTLGLGLGIPLFLLACAVIGCCVYYIYLAKRRRRRKRPMRREYESSDSPTMSGFSPTMIPTRFNTIGRGGPLYGSYFPEVGEGPESEDAFEVIPKTYRSGSATYVVPVGYQEREAFPSNFSWDFMYPHVDEDFSLPRPRV